MPIKVITDQFLGVHIVIEFQRSVNLSVSIIFKYIRV